MSVQEEEYNIEEVGITFKLIPDSIRNEAERIANKFSKVKKVLDKVKGELRERALNREIPYLSAITREYPRKFCTLAIDTSFTSPPIELTGGRLGIIYRVAIQFGSCRSKIVDHTAQIKFIDEDERIISILSKIIERKFIYDLISDPEVKSRYDLIIIDGELLPRVPPGALIGRGSGNVSKLYSNLVELTNRILYEAHNKDIPIVGILKRVYGRDIQVLLNKPSLDISDKALSSYILGDGEYLSLGTYSDIVNAYERFIEEHEEFKKKYKQRYRWLKNVVRHLPLSSAINVAIYKPKIKTYFSIPTKVELQLSSEYSLEEILGYLSSITSINGVPFPIDIADTLSRVKRNVIFIAQQSLYVSLVKLLNDSRLALSIVGLTNPEKMRSVGFKG